MQQKDLKTNFNAARDMSKELAKEYNKKYYSKNKERISAMLCNKETCPLCGRKVNHQSIPRHQESKLCKSRRATFIKPKEGLLFIDEESDEELDEETYEESDKKTDKESCEYPEYTPNNEELIYGLRYKALEIMFQQYDEVKIKHEKDL